MSGITITSVDGSNFTLDAFWAYDSLDPTDTMHGLSVVGYLDGAEVGSEWLTPIAGTWTE